MSGAPGERARLVSGRGQRPGGASAWLVRLGETGPVTETAVGRVVLDAARDIVVRHEQLRADLANQLDPDTGTVRLAFLDSMATTLVPKLLRAFHAEAPGVKVALSQEPAHDIRSDLDRGAVELGLTMDRDADLGWRTDRPLAPPAERFVTFVRSRSWAG